ncbi:MAG: hypothetical protein M1838_001529 [Thelocarpon superellum]|nr:MAG: hypothetical protein M1838_001529 [Thelocarpon superellum]
MAGSSISPGWAHRPGLAPGPKPTRSPSPVSIASSAGTKRKRGTEPKFYAVRVGHHPGVYHRWHDCLEQVKGFKNATFKSFPSLAEAEAFATGHDPPPDSASALSLALPKFYAVRNGRVPGVYTNWPSAQAQITGWTKPKHRCFTSRTEAEAFVHGNDMDTSSVTSDRSPGAPRIDTRNDTGPPAAKRTKKTNDVTRHVALPIPTAETPTAPLEPPDFEPGTGPLPTGAEDGFDPSLTLNPHTGQIEWKKPSQAQRLMSASKPLSRAGPIRIYTDGSSLGNGKRGAISGVGVYFGVGDERNVSEGLAGSRQTNQRAELTAISRALEITPRHRDACILTDSSYSINCVTVWSVNWRKNNWKTAAGKTVENKDLVEDILRKIEERKAMHATTEFQWIKGHAQDPGNVAADHLAVAGARKAKGS